MDETGERRGAERRQTKRRKGEPGYDGPERRAIDRRAGKDRRQTPRIYC